MVWAILPRGSAPTAGLGNRGSSAVGRLIEHGKVSGAELWCLDHDPKGLEAVSNAHGGSSNVIVIPKAEPVSPQCGATGECLRGPGFLSPGP